MSVRQPPALGGVALFSPSMQYEVGPLVVDAAFGLTDALPTGPLTGELPGSQVRRMMVADHLTFWAVDQLGPRDADAMRALATRLQHTALASLPGAH